MKTAEVRTVNTEKEMQIDYSSGFLYLLKMAYLISGINKVSGLSKESMNSSANYHSFNLTLFAS